MSDQANGPVPLSIADLAGAEVVPALVNALESSARKAAGEDRAAEVKDYAAACTQLAQAIVLLDPARLAGGDTPEGRKASIPTPPPTRDGDHDGQVGE